MWNLHKIVITFKLLQGLQSVLTVRIAFDKKIRLTHLHSITFWCFLTRHIVGSFFCNLGMLENNHSWKPCVQKDVSPHYCCSKEVWWQSSFTLGIKLAFRVKLPGKCSLCEIRSKFISVQILRYSIMVHFGCQWNGKHPAVKFWNSGNSCVDVLAISPECFHLRPARTN